MRTGLVGLMGLSMLMLVPVGMTGACARKRPMEPALAEVHDAALRTRMKTLERLAISDLGDAVGSRDARAELERIGRDLGATAVKIPDLVGRLDLDADDRSHFVAFADSLGESAARLEAAARTAPSAVVQARIEDVTTTCAGCHWAFRVGPEGD